MNSFKKIIAVLLSATAVISTAMMSVSALDVSKYDLNGDGNFDVIDVTYLQTSIADNKELTDTQKEIADYNKDGKIDVLDVTEAQILISEGDTPTPTEPSTQPTTQPKTEPATQPTTQPASSAYYNTEFADKVIELINNERAKEGLSAVKKDTDLTRLADIRAKETVTLFSHQRPDGSSWATILNDYNGSFRAAAENIAAGQRTPEAVVKTWMDSPSHHANIMNPEYNKIAISCYVDTNSTYRYYWEQLFIKG